MRTRHLSATCLALLTPLMALARPDPGAVPQGPGGPHAVVMPESISPQRDINYAGGANPAQTLDILIPKKPLGDKPLPAIVNIHGGGFFTGDKSMGLEDLVPLVAGGEFVGVTINYRLSAEAIWPAQIHDCKAAIRWVRANAKKYNIDPDRIGVIGGSAGGHLAAMLGVTNGNPMLEGEIGPNISVSSKVSCVVDQFGPADLVKLESDGSHEDHASPTSPEGRLLGGAVKDHRDTAISASPLTFVSRNAAPFLIIHGSDDPVIPHIQSERLYKVLKASGVEAYFITVTGAGHGGFHNPEVSERIRRFYEKELLARPLAISEEAIPN